ncbi:hypothetical protein B0H19DRAFT_916602 [Mycena capillaripes]|nr:hypothetical protein B0H19DRAFT_916602 [Mycena capillaripes]
MIYTTLPQPSGKTSDEPVTECLFFHGSQEVLASLPGFPQPLIHPETPAFRVAAVPGKGMGLFSTRALAEGDLILTERPLLISPIGLEIAFPPNFTSEQFFQASRDEMEMALQVAVNRMRPESRAAFMALANSHMEDGSGPLFGVVRTNGLGISGLRPGAKGDMSNYTATCKYISRLNHSCSPNTHPVFDKVSFSFRLWAVRDIAAGEELTFQYTDVECAAATRNEALEPYAFVCTCPSCTDAPASDARRAAIADFYPQVSIWAANRKLSNDWLLQKCDEQLALIETEKLQHLPAYFNATKGKMEAYICLGDAQSASKWAAKMTKQTWIGEFALNASKWAARLIKQVWATESTRIDALLGPANTAYQQHPMWRLRVDGPRPGSLGKLLDDMEALAGPGGISSL